MARLSLALLGPLQVRLDDQPVSSLAYAKVRALLAYLAVEARPHGRDALAELLWPEQPPAAARRSLRVALSTLRQALGEATAPVPFLIASRESVQVNRASHTSLRRPTYPSSCPSFSRGSCSMTFPPVLPSSVIMPLVNSVALLASARCRYASSDPTAQRASRRAAQAQAP